MQYCDALVQLVVPQGIGVVVPLDPPELVVVPLDPPELVVVPELAVVPEELTPELVVVPELDDVRPLEDAPLDAVVWVLLV
jgi:hypothetical protein